MVAASEQREQHSSDDVSAPFADWSAEARGTGRARSLERPNFRARIIDGCGIRRAGCLESSRPSRSLLGGVEGLWEMLSQCANSLCSKPFLRLREGKLFLVETERLARKGEPAAPPFVRARQQQRQVEHYWLCDECAAEWTLVYDRDRGVALAPLRRPVTSVPAAAGAASGVA